MTTKYIGAMVLVGSVLTQTSMAAAQPTTPAVEEPMAPAVEEPTAEAAAELTMPAAEATTMAPAEEAVAEAEAAMDAPAEAKPTSGYHKGFFVASNDGLFDMHIQQRVQSRFSFEAADGGTNDSAFEIARARLTLAGHAFTKGLSYKFQTDFGKGFVTLKDFYSDYQLPDGELRLRVGQFKRPFSRQQITSSGSQEFVDRSITDKFFGGGRDIGIAIHNDYEKSPEFEYALGVFNGTGDKSNFSGAVNVDPMTGEGSVSGGKFSNVPKRMHPAIVMRAGYNHGGIKGYSEADLEGGPLRYSVAASTLVDLDGDDNDASGIAGEADFVVKAEGFSSTGGVYASWAQDGTAFSDQSFAAIGFHLQAGYLLEERYQPTLRYAMISPEGSDNNVQEALAGMSIYFFEHGLKWQTDAGALLSQNAAGDTSDVVARTQLQLSF